MGYELREEVRDALPPGLLTAAERLVILEIANDARTATRRGMHGPEDIAPLVDMSPEAVRKHVQRIEAKGIPLRIEVGKDRNGRVMYAKGGKQVNYAIPPASVISGECLAGQIVQAEPGQSVQPWMDEPSKQGWTELPNSLDSPSTPTPQYPSDIPPPTRAEQHAGVEVEMRIINQSGQRVNGGQRTRLVAAIAKALAAGWPEPDIIAELQRPTIGLTDVGAGLIARIRDLGQPPMPEPTREPSEPCPIHRGSISWRTCSSCWGAIKGGDDPYMDRPDLRPDGWEDAFLFNAKY